MQNQAMDRRKKYTQNQRDKGMVRFELTLPAELKEKFEAMAQELSEEYA